MCPPRPRPPLAHPPPHWWGIPYFPPVVLLVMLSDCLPQFSLLVRQATPWGASPSPANCVESVRPKKAVGFNPPLGFYGWPSHPSGTASATMAVG